MSTKASTAVGAVVAILIIGAVAVLGYYQVVIAPGFNSTSPTATTTSVVCPSAQCKNVTIPSGASTTAPGFTPDTITVMIGVNNTIYWINTDTVIHTATSDQGAPSAFNTGNIPPGTSAQVTILVPGTYTYHCNYHSIMTGKIIVLAGSTSTSTSSSTSH